MNIIHPPNMRKPAVCCQCIQNGNAVVRGVIVGQCAGTEGIAAVFRYFLCASLIGCARENAREVQAVIALLELQNKEKILVSRHYAGTGHNGAQQKFAKLSAEKQIKWTAGSKSPPSLFF
ncbi:MAG: hypothetical protein RSB55_03660 [Oscillospiraceae bacterium]